MSTPERLPQPDKIQSADAAPILSAARRDVTFRAVALGSALIPFNAFSVVRLEKVLFGPYPSTIALFANVIFVLFILAALNTLLVRFAPRLAFAQGELLTLYAMLAISTGLAGLDGVGAINQMMAHGGWFGAARGWNFLGAFPRWLVVSDADALKGHFLGNSTLYRAAILRAWRVPVGAWTLFVTLLLFVAHCVNILVRRQWADRERLTFPIVWLPLAMTEGGTGAAFFSNRLMWAGFTAAAGIGLWNGLAFLYPSLPALPIGTMDLKPFLTAKPWNAIDWLPPDVLSDCDWAGVSAAARPAVFLLVLFFVLEDAGRFLQRRWMGRHARFSVRPRAGFWGGAGSVWFLFVVGP